MKQWPRSEKQTGNGTFAPWFDGHGISVVDLRLLWNQIFEPTVQAYLTSLGYQRLLSIHLHHSSHGQSRPRRTRSPYGNQYHDGEA